MIELQAGDYRLLLDPARGGSVACFEWRGKSLFRPTGGDTILDTGCFPLVPFSNRIAQGHFRFGERDVQIAPNFPGGDHPHPLHGFGWLAPWQVIAQDSASARLAHDYPGGEWPWPYRAEQHLILDPKGLTMALSVTNLGDTAMPTGLGFHPYFPREPGTRYSGRHSGEWTNTADCLPLTLDERSAPIDWWSEQPVGDRVVDTVYTGREGELRIEWPERNLSLAIIPSGNLPHTVVFTPPEADYFCVEPVSHMTNAVNRRGSGVITLPSGETLTVSIRLESSILEDTY